MTLNEEIKRAKTDFYAFVETLPKQVGATPEAVIAGWWTARLLSIATKTADALRPVEITKQEYELLKEIHGFDKAVCVRTQLEDFDTKRKEWFTN